MQMLHFRNLSLGQRLFIVPALSLMLMFWSCEEKDCCVLLEDENRQLTGSWLLYERGYSPGFGYEVVEVDPFPPQVLTFRKNFRMSSTIPGLTDYAFYRIEKDTHTDQKIVALYKTDPGDSAQDPSAPKHSYLIELHDDTLKLSFRYCFEGCHLGLKRISGGN